MFQFTGLPSVPYVFRYGYRRITSGEFPHSEIPGSQNGQLLPRAYRSRPRPSSALSAKASTVCPCSLDQKNTGYRCRYGVFKVHAGEPLPPAQAPSPSKLNSVRRTNVELDVIPGEPASWTTTGLKTSTSSTGASAYRSNCSGFPRKEVIQPQLPLRLPCYDFTPIIDPTFDGSLPCGLGHRLRVLPTFVV
jgi:hypothetical protein